MPPFEPALEEDLSDARLASLLAADAREASKRYSTQGLAALLGGRHSSTPKVKPNTRFLKNLVQNTDSHNDRLKRKEDAERRAKLKKLEQQDQERQAENNHQKNGEDVRARKRRKRDHNVNHEGRRDRSDEHYRGREKRRQRRRHERRNTSSESSQGDIQPKSNSKDREKSEQRHGSRQKHSRTDSEDEHRHKSHSHRKHKRRRSDSPTKRLSPQEDHDGPRAPSKEESPTPVIAENPHFHPPTINSHNSGSTIQPPTTNEDDTDWHLALSALRDRGAFQRIQTSRRLNTGSASNNSLSSLEPEKSIKDVKWNRNGEQREWDKGKPTLTFSDDDNTVDDDLNEKKNISNKTKSSPPKTHRQEGWKKSGGLLRGFKSALGT